MDGLWLLEIQCLEWILLVTPPQVMGMALLCSQINYIHQIWTAVTPLEEDSTEPVSACASGVFTIHTFTVLYFDKSLYLHL